jgi:hypothetical protein
VVHQVVLEILVLLQVQVLSRVQLEQLAKVWLVVLLDMQLGILELQVVEVEPVEMVQMAH